MATNVNARAVKPAPSDVEGPAPSDVEGSSPDRRVTSTITPFSEGVAWFEAAGSNTARIFLTVGTRRV